MATPGIDQTWIAKIDYNHLLGHGGFGYVYKVWEESVAVKVIKKNEDPEEFIEDTEKCLKKLPKQHPNIIDIYNILEDLENKYVFMEYCELGNLKKIFHKQVLDTRVRVALMTQIANGIACLHENGIIHRDIKPENILLKHSDDDPWVQVKLSDFGLSKFLEDQSTMSSDVGTNAFKAPEFWQRDKEGRLHYKKAVDIFATGLTFLAMLQNDSQQKFAPGIEIATSLDPSEQEQPIGYTMHVRKKNDQTIPNIIAGEGDEITLQVKCLIREMINVKPEDRVCAEDVHATLDKILQTCGQ